ncbi:tetratricopeptide repeat protein [Aquabacterium sp. A7-Y]|uniref:tetratricopeptide repeat protein n=1 Tax=Aquabacterium sp. A7-Y TaxID=1349605 RepID=UPI00223E635B|nr:tetratricopeptide repeat protein [Aquabacterium sp. A7-Y]MCW7541482.1 tetratricopeptide repeat protein [Aquabacterium sp. A7-Y]
MRLSAALLLCASLLACGHPPPATAPPDALFQDAAFGAPSAPVRREDVFALSEAMQHYLHTEIAQQLRQRGRQKGLMAALYSRAQLQLDYDTTSTGTAAQAFESRSGNCLSLVIMTAAFAKALGLQVDYRSASLDASWSRSGGLYLLSGHVNLTLGRRLIDAGTARDVGASTTIDFLPPEDLRGLRTQAITEDRVVAMFMNNRAAESLLQGRLDDAYWWAREAVVQDAGFLAAYNTLGVIYLRRGLPGPAEQAFAQVLRQEPGDTRALANLALLLRRQGRQAEAETLQRRLSQAERTPPYHYFELGLAALQDGDPERARGWFAREAERDPEHADFQFWLGVTELRLGRPEAARRHLERALQRSTRADQRRLYAAKLDRLRGGRGRAEENRP